MAEANKVVPLKPVVKKKPTAKKVTKKTTVKSKAAKKPKAAPTKKTAVKTVTKKAAVKKSVAKTAKKPVVKKAAKTTVKKTQAKKSVAKKPAAKKIVSKKTAIKKPALKKTNAKKTAAKKAAFKKQATANTKPKAKAKVQPKVKATTKPQPTRPTTNIKTETIMTQGQAQFDQFTKEAANINREGIDAFVKAGTLFAKGFENIMKETMALAQTTTEKQMQLAKDAMTSKTINEFSDAQNKLAQTSFDDFMSGTTKITELGVKLFSEAIEPINEQVQKSVQKATDAVAAE